MRINFGILGAGRISKIHCHNIYNNPKAKILKIYDINKKLSESLAKNITLMPVRKILKYLKIQTLMRLLLGAVLQLILNI